MTFLHHRIIEDPAGATRAEISPFGLIKNLWMQFDGCATPVEVSTQEVVQHVITGRWDGAEHAVLLNGDDRSHRDPQPAGRYDTGGSGTGPASFCGSSANVAFDLTYRIAGPQLHITVGVANQAEAAFSPDSLSLNLNIDSYMDRYPEWNDRYFPTQLRCEKTHFWGYYMSPAGQIITMCSPDPIASWSLLYNKRRPAWGRYRLLEDGHRVHGVRLALMHSGPLPKRHPDNTPIEPGENREWTVVLEPAADLSQVMPMVARNCGAPAFEIDRHTVGVGGTSKVVVHGPQTPALTCIEPGSMSRSSNVELHYHGSRANTEVTCSAVGEYRLVAKSKAGKVSEARLYARRPWTWYLRQAREQAFVYPPNETGHVESWASFGTWFSARRFVPDKERDQKAEEMFLDLFPKIYDLETGLTRDDPWRIQNNGMMICYLAERYRASGNVESLEWAQPIADAMIACQGEDGGYYSPRRGVHYTSVAYMAKGLMELMSCEKSLADASQVWADRYDRHKESVDRAIADLNRRKDNVGTEGEMTFEDGMISCSSLQLAYYALVFGDERDCSDYVDTAAYLSRLHRCLTYLKNPDARMHGATLRFWESKFNVLAYSNMLNSPCGWTAWKIYGQWYLYQLTGEWRYLRYTMDALGTCAQLIDGETGKLRWAFVPDPYVETLRHIEYPKGSGQARLVEDVVGEEYLEMVSDWYRDQEVVRKTWCIDNLVHEIFKCISEIALRSTYVYVQSDGTVEVFNGTAAHQADTLVVIPAEDVVDAVHVNLGRKGFLKLAVHFATGVRQSRVNEPAWVLDSGKIARTRPL